MTFKTLATAACIALSSATASLAAPINLDFTFGAATGTFYGLNDEDGSSQATSFDLAIGSDFWTAVSTSGGGTNVFTFLAGVLTSVNFDKLPVISSNSSPDVILYDIFFSTNDGQNSWIEYGEFAIDSSNEGTEQVSYTISPLSPVPLPAGGFLLLSGLAGVVALKRRKKRTA
jgi:hypothetical protein